MKVVADDSIGSKRAPGDSSMREPSDSVRCAPAGGASTATIASPFASRSGPGSWRRYATSTTAAAAAATGATTRRQPTGAPALARQAGVARKRESIACHIRDTACLVGRIAQAVLQRELELAHDTPSSRASGGPMCARTATSAAAIRRLAVASEQPHAEATSVSSSPSTIRSIQAMRTFALTAPSARSTSASSAR